MRDASDSARHGGGVLRLAHLSRVRRCVAGLQSVVALAATVVIGALPGAVYATDRFALVIGNSRYAAFYELPNPRNDASDVGAALERLGFEVTTVVDGGRLQMHDALQSFARRSVGASIAVVFYAGHGMEMDGANYLIPIDARLERDTDVEYETVQLDRVLRATGRGGSAAGHSRCMPQQPSGAEDAASTRDTKHKPRQLWRSGRAAATGRNAGGVCGGRGDDSGRWGRSQQPLYGGAARASGGALGNQRAIPTGAEAGAGNHSGATEAARISVAVGRSLPDPRRDGLGAERGRWRRTDLVPVRSIRCAVAALSASNHRLRRGVVREPRR